MIVNVRREVLRRSRGGKEAVDTLVDVKWEREGKKRNAELRFLEVKKASCPPANHRPAPPVRPLRRFSMRRPLLKPLNFSRISSSSFSSLNPRPPTQIIAGCTLLILSNFQLHWRFR